MKNILVLIHGITPDRNPPDPAGGDYAKFLAAIQARDQSILGKFDKTIQIKWGEKYPGNPAGDYSNYLLAEAERKLTDLSQDNTVSSPTNEYHEKSRPWYHPIDLAIAGQMRNIKRSIVTYGLSDAIFYCSDDGERDMRKFVYKQVSDEILAFVKAGQEVAIHVVAHSLGVTVAHDFLYGIFNKNQSSDFSADQAILAEVRDAYKGVQAFSFAPPTRKVFLGSFTAMASQLPLMAVRRDKLVRLFAAGQKMDAADIGVGTLGSYMQVSFFHDPDDVLGFPSRELYQDNPAMRDVCVDNGLAPADGHTKYWTNDNVIQDVVEKWIKSLNAQAARAAGFVAGIR